VKEVIYVEVWQADAEGRYGWDLHEAYRGVNEALDNWQRLLEWGHKARIRSSEKGVLYEI
jgi:protocatechuate 3,4-dioxygenase beta subunit